MVVVGIPNGQEKHAEFAADMAIDMLVGLKKVELPFLEDKMTVKIGLLDLFFITNLSFHRKRIILRDIKCKSENSN